MVTVLHAPLKAPLARRHPRRVTRAVQKLAPDFGGLTEAYGIVRPLGRVRGYRMVLEEGGADQRRGQKDNPILVRDELVSLGSGQLFGCSSSTPERLAPERWISFAAVRLPDRDVPHCHIGMHPHAGVQAVDGGLARTDRARKYRQQMLVFDRFLDFADAMGWTVTVSADLNFRDEGDSAWSPYRIMRDHGLAVAGHGLDAIGSTRSLRLHVREVPAPPGVTDHPWLLGTAG